MASVDQLLAVARAEINNTEKPAGSNRQKYGEWFGFNGVQWCSIFVAWTYGQVGIDVKRTVAPGYASCATALAGYDRLGWTLHDKRQALPGDVVFYDFPGDGTNITHHTGIVESAGPGGVTAIEGNTSGAGSQTNGGAVLRKMRSWAAVKAVCRVPLDVSAPVPAPGTPAPGTTPAPVPAPSLHPIPEIDNEDNMRIFKLFGGQHYACFANRERRPITQDHADKLRWFGVPYAVVEDQAASWVIAAQWDKEIPAV